LSHTGRRTPAACAAGAAEGGTLFFGVPTVWSRVAADPAAAGALRFARLLVSGSAGLPVPVFERLAAGAGQAPIERYGMTETGITVSGRADEGRRGGGGGRAGGGGGDPPGGEGGGPRPAAGGTGGGGG